MAKVIGIKRGIGVLCLTLIIGFFNNCGGGGKSAGSTDGASTAGSGSGSGSAGLAAFKSGLYAYAKTQNCAMCHGVSTAPLFAQADVNAAYLAAKGDIDFSNPDLSVIATYAGNAHCAAAPCSTPSNTATVKTILEAWAAAELADQSGGGTTGGTTVVAAPKYFTAAVAVPAKLPTLSSSAIPGVIRFQLSDMKPAVASLSGAILEIEVQLANIGTYRINRVKIMGNTAAVSVTGIHVYVKAPGTVGNGVEDPNQGLGWVGLTASAPVSTLPTPLPAGPLSATPLFTNALAVQLQSTADMFTIGIDNLQ